MPKADITIRKGSLMPFLKISRKNLTMSFIVVLPIVIFVLLSFYNRSKAERGISERDYIIDRSIQFQGSVAIVGRHYTISAMDYKWPQQVTFVMHKDRSLMVRIYPIKKPAGLLMLASETSSPRLVKPVWANDYLRDPVSFWTDNFWIRNGTCDHTGCPKIRFQATRGTIGVSILDKRR
jgi:hypothetical protein